MKRSSEKGSSRKSDGTSTNTSNRTADIDEAVTSINIDQSSSTNQRENSQSAEYNGSTQDQATLQSRHDQDEPPHQEDHPFRRIIPFLFPTLADLPGLLVTSGSVFQSSQNQIRRRYLKSKREQEELQKQLEDAEKKERENFEETNLRKEISDFHLEDKFMVQYSESDSMLDELELEDDISEQPVLPNTLNAFLHQSIGGEVGSEIGSEESAELENGDMKASYHRGAYILLVILGIIVFGYIGGAMIFFLKIQKPGHPYTCRTQNCERMAHWVKAAMDPSVKPCDDFYQFACGGYKKKHPASEEAEFASELHLYRDGIPINFKENEKTGNLLKRVDSFPDNQLLPYYQACIDTKRRDKHGVNPFVNLLAQIRLFHIQSGAYFSIISKLNVARVIGRIYRRTNRLFFFDLDEVKDNVMLLKLAKPAEEVLNTPANVYADAMRKCWKAFSKDLLIESDLEIETIVYHVMRFEAELAIIQSKESSTYVFGFPISFDEQVPPPPKFHKNFIKMRGRFDWDELVAAIMGIPPENLNAFHISFNFWSSFYSRQDRYYALYMQDKLRNTPGYVLFRYFQWSLMKMFAFDLNKEIQDIMLTIFRASGQNLVERCFRSVFSNLHVLAAHRYQMMITDTHSIHKNMTAITEKVFHTFTERVSSLDLPIAMKAALLATVKTLKIVINDPEGKLHVYLKTYYQGLNCSKDHFFNVVQAKSIKARNGIIAATKKPPFHKWWDGDYSLTEWTETSIADSWSTIRYLHVPFGAIQEPFLGNDLPILNYAGFGHYLVSVALMKFGVDDLFQVYEANYRIWEPRDEIAVFKAFQKTFLEITECVVSTQSKLKLKDFPDLQINSEVPAARVRMVAQTFALELTVLVIEHLINATASMKGSVQPFKSPMDEIRHANQMIGQRFPNHQVLPGLEKYTPFQLVFLSLARHHCQTYSRARAETRMKFGPLLNEIVIHGSFRNSKDFAAVWKCPKNSFMNPKKRCSLLARNEDKWNGVDQIDTTEDEPKQHSDDDDDYNDANVNDDD